MIAIVDELQVAGTLLDTVQARYLAEYAPTARQRGMTLLSFMQNPPVRLHEGMNTLTFTWTVPNLPAWWRMRLSGAADPGVAEFWHSIAHQVASRTRRFHTLETSLLGETADV